jgi:hypothetical protein
LIIARPAAAAAAILLTLGALSGCSLIPNIVNNVKDNAEFSSGGCPDSVLEGFKSGYLQSTKGTDAENADISAIEASEFQVQEVGDDMLTAGCYFRVSFETSGVSVVLDEAIIPKGGDAKSVIGGRLTDAGFVSDASAPDSYVNDDGRNVSIVDQIDGVDLDTIGGAYKDGVVVITVYSIN